ncbi:MAG: 16S rRNA (uracil(1498)-N(3))-methyltransferase [Lewinellaceae bacterium]|nr:16S rRNA (uracil(1498)-N(3))-methyltransferase [Lewinellaceae bacterium]
MNLFYTTTIDGQMASLPEEEARHCIQALRHKVGDIIHITDGKGTLYEARIVEAGRKQCKASIERALPSPVRRNHFLHLAIAPTKNIARLEWFLEKATEIGIDEVTPLICEHSERRKLRLDRLEKVLASAMKQSLKVELPKLNAPALFDEFIRQPIEPGILKYIAYLGPGVKEQLKGNYQPGSGVCILIGPEGGFSPAEAQSAASAGFTPVSLGPSRLRTETAGIVACHTINLLNE